MAGELAKQKDTLGFRIWKQRQTLTPRFMDDIECKLTGAILHLHKQ